MNRRELRDRVFKLLFRIEFNPEADMPEQVKMFCEDEEYGTFDEEDSKFVSEKYDAIIQKKADIDKLINDNSTGWDTTRIGKVELTVLRLAVYEMCFDDSIPVGVAMNEAVEIAKTYGRETSGSFVNAILTKVKNSENLQ